MMRTGTTLSRPFVLESGRKSIKIEVLPVRLTCDVLAHDGGEVGALLGERPRPPLPPLHRLLVAVRLLPQLTQLALVRHQLQALGRHHLLDL